MKNEEPLSAGGEGENYEPHFEPIITLPEVKIVTMEEDEVVLIQLRAKLFRLDTVEKDWKERGTGEVKLLHHEKKNTVRVVMRRDKTLKLCANHYVTPIMELKPNCGSDRAWVWTTLADFSDGSPHTEILAIKFINSETAMKWKEMFEKAKTIICSQVLCSDDDDEDEDDYEEDDKEEEDSKTCKEENGSEDSKIVNEINKLKIKTEEKSEDKNEAEVESKKKDSESS